MDGHTAVRFIAIYSSAFVMWFPLCAMSLSFIAHCQWLSLGDSLFPMPTILSSLGHYVFVLFDVFSSDTQGTGNRSSSSLCTCFDLSLTCAYRRTVCTNEFLTPCILSSMKKPLIYSPI